MPGPAHLGIRPVHTDRVRTLAELAFAQLRPWCTAEVWELKDHREILARFLDVVRDGDMAGILAVLARRLLTPSKPAMRAVGT